MIFGFQKANVANQREHLILLLENAYARQTPKPNQKSSLAAGRFKSGLSSITLIVSRGSFLQCGILIWLLNYSLLLTSNAMPNNNEDSWISARISNLLLKILLILLLVDGAVKKLKEPLDEPEREIDRRRRAGRNIFKNEASSSANSRSKPTPPPREHSSPNSDGFQNPIVLPVEQTRNIVDLCDIWLIQGVWKAKEWLDKTPPTQITMWEQLVSRFLDYFFPNDNILPWGNIRQKAEGEEGPEWVVMSKVEDNISNFMLEKNLYGKGLG
uniref:Callose synthase 3 n=1 Tax=Tanacetum cinerariifolium TaxID=118510 RepID=A0A6L2K5L9_TANCI|nr:callose synthase 3 [Tanacetum cinerariifolium]